MAQVQVTTLLSQVTQICRECPTATLVQAYVDAARQFCNRSRWLTMNVEVTSEIDEPLYTLVADAFHEVIGIRAMALSESGTLYEPLTEGFTGTWNPNDEAGLPREYQYVPEGRFTLHQTPRLAYPLRVMCIVQPVRGAVSLDAALLTSWDYALQAGALAYLLALARTPWTDRKEAQIQEMRFRASMNEAASSVLRGYNAGAETTDRNGSTSGGLRTRILPI